MDADGRSWPLWNWHLDAICEHLEAVTNAEILELLINIPPRHAKSLIVSVFWPMWEWIKYPSRKFLTASYAYQLSIRDSVRCRRLITSDWYQTRWGDRFELSGDQNEKVRFENNKTGMRLATSVGGLGTGEGADRIVVDDPLNVKEAESEAMRAGVLLWWDETMSTRLNDHRIGAKVIVMQRIHEQDLAGHVLSKGTYTHLCLPARYEGNRCITTIPKGKPFEDPRSEMGEALWPERFGEEFLTKLEKAMGPYAAAGQLQQRPTPREGGLFKRTWMRFWQYPGQVLSPVPVMLGDGSIHYCPVTTLPLNGLKQEDWLTSRETIQSWDMTFKDVTGSDFVVGQVWVKDGANGYLMDQTRARRDFPATVMAMIGFKTLWPATQRILVEDKANGPAVISMLKNHIPGLIGVNPEGDKVARASAVTYLFEAGNIYLPHPENAPWVAQYIDELASFPKGAQDDCVDATSQALVRLLVGSQGVDLSPFKHWLSAYKGRRVRA